MGCTRILTKRDMYRLYYRNGFGNRMPCWASLDEYYLDNFKGKVGLRYEGNYGGGYFVPYLTRDTMPGAVKWVIRQGARPELIRVSEMAPHYISTISGEVQRSEKYIDLTYSHVKLPVRQAIFEDRHIADGLTALMILKSHLDEPSMDNLTRLLDEYPESVVEFSAFETGAGVLGWNTVFWEVRNY